MKAEREKRLGCEFYKKVLDQLYHNICITDFETDQIVYMNDSMKKNFHLEGQEGTPCWQLAQNGKKQRCENCYLNKLKPGDGTFFQERVDVLNGRSYKSYDSLLEWDGMCYHVQMTSDITQYVELSENANIDELTGTLNRRAGKERLAELVNESRENGQKLTVILYDINQLKQVNDAYGHSEGDHLLCYVTGCVSRHLTRRDLIFRLSGDEFIVAFCGRDMAEAEKRMQMILKEMKDGREAGGIYYEASFSYGIVEVYPGEENSIPELIARADEQMYLQKRNFHIRQAKERLDKAENLSGAADNFEYDKDHLYEALAASTDDYVYIGNMKTGTFRYSPAMVEEFGLPGEVVENAAAVWGRLIHPHDEKGFLESNQEIADGRSEFHNIEYRAKNVRGEWIWLRCRGKMIRDSQGRPNLFAGIITNLGKKNLIDHMTGLYNRYELEGEVKRYLVEGGGLEHMGILILDMDSFKNINDLYDRSFGDEVLRITAQKISSFLPSNARIFRMDGDEFAILLLNPEPEAQARIFNNIRYRFQRQQEYGGKKYHCTISAGYASWPEDGKTYLELMKCANYSLEHSKLLGKNRLTSFSPGILKEKARRLELAELLRESIEHGFSGFSMHYQPQVSTVTGKLHGAEALIRWHCAKYGDVSPEEFIPMLEESGLIIHLGGWLFDRAVNQCREWCEKQPEFKMSINVSYLQLSRTNFVPFVTEGLERFGVKPSSVVLELTETYLMKEEKVTTEILQKFHEMGLLLAMDDFGTGYSFLLSLKNVPIDLVKIDRGFVKGITTNRFNAAFVRAIAEFCHNVGKAVCVEGVETEEEYRTIREFGPELIQGYYFGTPMEAHDFENKWFKAID